MNDVETLIALSEVVHEPWASRLKEHVDMTCNWKDDDGAITCAKHDVLLLPAPGSCDVSEVFSDVPRAISMIATYIVNKKVEEADEPS